VFWPARPSFGSQEPTTRGLWARTGRRIARRPRLVWVGTTLVLGAMAVGLVGLHAGGLTTAQGFRGTPDSVAGQAVLDVHFPGGAGQPVQVFGDLGSGPRLAAALESVPGLTAVTKPQVVAGHDYLEATLTAAPDSQAAYAAIDRARAACSVSRRSGPAAARRNRPAAVMRGAGRKPRVLVARRAGPQLAVRVAATKSAITVANIDGSRGPTPSNMSSATGVRKAAAAIPITSPIAR